MRLVQRSRSPRPRSCWRSFDAQGRLVVEGLDHIQAPVDGIHVQEGLAEPATKQPPAHGCLRVVKHVQETALDLAAADGLGQLQVAPGRLIQGHELAGGVAVQAGHLAQC